MVNGVNHVLHGGFAKKDSEIIVLNDSKAVGGAGHMAMVAGNDKKVWTYVASGGRVDTDGNSIIGGNSVSILENTGTTPELSNRNSALKYLSRYDLKASIKTTYQNAMKAVNAAYKSANGYYHILFHNCGHVVRDGLQAINVYGGERFTSSPNMRYLEMITGGPIIR
ncbi:MAG: hypothetical protein E2604_05360 [Flavobacterium sp.]|nr:hypothetical protein [Flavobacterium sp.]